MIEIDSLDDPRIAPYRSLRTRPDALAGEGLFVTDGERVTRALLQSKLEVVSVLALPDVMPGLTDLLERRGIPAAARYVASRDLVTGLVGFRFHQGVLALARQPDSVPLPDCPLPFVALDGLHQSENVGAICRTAAAFGVRSLVVDAASASPWLRRSVRVSMGSVLDLAIHISADLAQTLGVLQCRHNVRVVGASLADGAVPLSSYAFPERFCLVIGSEGHGMSPAVSSVCDARITIPMQPAVQSLNAAAAAAVFLYRALG